MGLVLLVTSWLSASCAAPPAQVRRDSASVVQVTPRPSGGVPPKPRSPDVDLARLARLQLQARNTPRPPYARSAFGDAWSDVDGNGCNQRDDVLLRDAVHGTVKVRWQHRCDHDVIAGTWIDPYTGRTLRFDNLKDLHQAEAIQIDHVVPLAEAWMSGASAWSADRRQAFANDLDELLAVDGPTNAGKGDGDPAAWRPRKSYQCRYARHWIRVKLHWKLAVDESERQALRQMLGYCV